MIPTLNVTALNIAYMMGGVVIVERVFGFPGFGSLTVDAMLTLDVPLIEATVLIAAAVYIGANLLADIETVLLNPRLRTPSDDAGCGSRLLGHGGLRVRRALPATN